MPLTTVTSVTDEGKWHIFFAKFVKVEKQVKIKKIDVVLFLLINHADVL